MEIKIRRATQAECVWIAKLHKEAIPAGFLSKLGETFLAELYKAISRNVDSSVHVVEVDGRIGGFIAGTTATNRLYKEVLMQNWYRFCIPLVRFVFNIKTIVKIFETLVYGLKKNRIKSGKLIHAELLSIAVDASRRSNGAGKRLVDTFEAFLRERLIDEYKVVTFAPDTGSNRFYLACGFKLSRTFRHHKNQMNEYVKRLQ